MLVENGALAKVGRHTVWLILRMPVADLRAGKLLWPGRLFTQP